MVGVQTWVINLDRAPERLARISAQLQRLQLPFTRLAAVDARALTPLQRAALDEPAFRRKHGMTPVPGELGCYLSHVAVMRAFLASEADFALVLEDDVLLHDSLPAVLNGLMQNAARWDVVKLSAVHRGTPVPYAQVAPGHRLAVMLSRCTGSSAYLINRRAAQAYLRSDRGLLPMSLPYDHAAHHKLVDDAPRPREVATTSARRFMGRGFTIAGGSSEIQHNQLAKQVLGL